MDIHTGPFASGEPSLRSGKRTSGTRAEEPNQATLTFSRDGVAAAAYTVVTVTAQPDIPDWLAADDAALLRDCDIHVYKASGPGGQHRNKVSSAVKLRHRPTTLTTHGDDSRSQHTNKRLALSRLRMQIALQIRRPVNVHAWEAGLPEPLDTCVVRSAKAPPPGGRMQVGRKDDRFWPAAQHLLDLLDACEGRLADAAGVLGVSTSNLVAHLKKDRHLFAAAAKLRKHHGHGPLK